MDHPPLVSGRLPLAGHALEFLRHPEEALVRGWQERGNAFTLDLGGQKAAVLVGPEHNKWFFDHTDKLLSMREGYPFLVRMFDERVYFFAEPREYLAQRSILLPCFKGARLNDYLPAMAEEARAFLDGIGDGDTVDLVPALGPLVMKIAARSFLGDLFREQVEDAFFDLFRDFAAALDPVTPSWVPLPKFRRARRARARLHTWLRGLIDERRRAPVDPPDFLQSLLEARDADGERLPDEMLVHLVLVLVWAGHETTTGHLAWAILDLLRHPEWLARVREEVDAVLIDRLDRDALGRLGHLDRALKETERAHPVAFWLMRGVKEPVQVDGYEIPAGWFVAISPWLTHRMPEVFPEPEVYNPDRHDKKKHGPLPRHALVGFGGGLHRCTGVNFAYQEMAVVTALMLRQFDLELLDVPRVMPGAASKWPDSPCRVRFHRRAGVAGLDVAAAPVSCPYHAAG